MISSYFKRIANYTPVRFIIEVTSLAFVSRFFIVLPVAFILALVGFDLGSVNIETLNLTTEFWRTVLLAVIIAPFVETLIFQLVPLTFFRLIRVPSVIAIILSTFLFAYAHLDDGLINFIGMIPIGFLFVWAFTVRQKRSVKEAIFVVFMIHALTNFLATILYLLSN